MKLKFLTLFIIIGIISCSKNDDTSLTDELSEDPTPTTELLSLPKGIISTGSKGTPIEQEIIDNSNVDGFMILNGWNAIETSEGVFDWSHIDSEVARASAANKVVRIALHAGGKSVPNWVTENYPTIKEIFVYDKITNEKRYHPAYWDLTFIQVKSNFYEAIAERYNGNDTVFAISVSMVDPNTGDWAFPIEDDEQRQSFLDAGFTEAAFINAYKTLIDNAMDNFGDKYAITAVGPIPTSLVSDKYFAIYEVLNYAFETYNNRLIIAKGSLSANTADPIIDTNLRAWQMIWDFKPHCAGQFVWGVTNDPNFKMNGGNAYLESEKSAIFRKAADIGIAYELNWIEPWRVDVLNPDLQDDLEYARNKLRE